MPIQNAIPSEFKKTMLEVYKQDAKQAKIGFLSNLFETRPEWNVDTEKVSLDIVKSSKKIAPVVTGLGGSAVEVSSSIFEGMEVAAPVYKLKNTVDIFNLLQREPGETEWSNARVSWAVKVANKIRDKKSDHTSMITRSLEKQAAELLQNGTITLTDENGKDAYTLNFQKDAKQMVTPAVKWDASGASIEKDISALAEELSEQGFTATTLIFGSDAWSAFMKDDNIKELVFRDKFDMGTFTNERRDKGEVYKGRITLGDFDFYLYTYNASYEEFASKNKVRYLDRKNVLMLPDEADMDFRLVQTVYPQLGSKSRFANLVPEEAVINKIRFYNKIWDNEETDATYLQTAARPLCLPASLDCWGVLKNVCS